MSASAPPAPDHVSARLNEDQVKAMFDRIASVYDRMNQVMTAGLDRQWRRRAAELAGVRPGDRALDVATGTGDLALELAARVGPTGEVIGTDFSERMLELARAKASSRNGDGAGAVPLKAASTRSWPRGCRGGVRPLATSAPTAPPAIRSSS